MAGQRDDAGLIVRKDRADILIAVSRSNSSERLPSSRTMDWLQKNDDQRLRRVISLTLCRLVDG